MGLHITTKGAAAAAGVTNIMIPFQCVIKDIKVFFSSELWRVITLSFACGRFTEASEKVFTSDGNTVDIDDDPQQMLASNMVIVNISSHRSCPRWRK